MNTENKLTILTKIAHRLNAANITWAVGGSMLLYFKGIVSEFRDIDIMVKDEDAQAAKTILLSMGTLEPQKSSAKYKTKAFYEFTVDGVDIDVMAGFVIVKDSVDYDCSLNENEIAEHIILGNEKIPLHSVAVWRRYYELMEKPEKVRMIDEAAG